MPVFVNIVLRAFIVVLFLWIPFSSGAQRFKVASFRVLSNDVSAFVNPVFDLNDEACSLIKVEGSPDFVFSTPLGIVKRVDHVGEIWLYVPKGSKKITLKHPQWGVLRDFNFPMKTESHLSYELRLETPEQHIDRMEASAPVVVHDTLVLTRTDTLMLSPKRQRIPLSVSLLSTAGFGGKTKSLSGGIMAAVMKRHGGFIHFSSDFGHLGKTIGECDSKGYIDGRLPYYSGKTRHAFMLATVGAIHRVSGKVRLFEGIGYGFDNTAWQLAQSEGNGYVRNSANCHSGPSFEFGSEITIGRLAISASLMSINGAQWYGSIGIGVTFNPEKKK